MTAGTVIFFNDDKGWGFVHPDGAPSDVFVHRSAVEAAGWGTLAADQRLEFDIEEHKPGKRCAINLKGVPK